MHQRRYWIGFLALLLLSFSTQAVSADNCTGMEQCVTSGTGLNVCDFNNCTVQFSHSNGQLIVTVQINGASQQIPTTGYFCAYNGTKVSWQTADDVFLAKFSTSPFTNGQLVVSGTAGGAQGTTVNSPTAQTCYSYGAASCSVSATATGGGCGEHDPRIVITGNNYIMKATGSQK